MPDEIWTPQKTEHADLALRYWFTGGDLFWEGEWLESWRDAVDLLEKSTELDDEYEGYDKFARATANVIRLNGESGCQEEGSDLRFKLFYQGSTRRFFMLVWDYETISFDWASDELTESVFKNEVGNLYSFERVETPDGEEAIRPRDTKVFVQVESKNASGWLLVGFLIGCAVMFAIMKQSVVP